MSRARTVRPAIKPVQWFRHFKRLLSDLSAADPAPPRQDDLFTVPAHLVVKHCYQCDRAVNWLASDGRCYCCTRMVAEQILHDDVEDSRGEEPCQ